MVLHHFSHEGLVGTQEVHVQMSRYFDNNGQFAMGNIHITVQGLFSAEYAGGVGKEFPGKGEH